MRATGGELYRVTGRVTDLVSTNLLEGCAGPIQFGHNVSQLSAHGCQKEADEMVWQLICCHGSSCEELWPKYVLCLS